MCELFGITTKYGRSINTFLKIFYSHSNKHPHGWGLACMDGHEVLLEKESIQASKSNYLKERLSQPIIVKTALAHIRYATIGNVEYSNCHPYSEKDNFGRRWTMIHNGTIFDYAPLNGFLKLQKGDTDSERILLYLVDRINKAQRAARRPLNDYERFYILDEIIADMSRNNKLNLLFYDGEYLYVHTNYANSLYVLQYEDTAIFSTVPLTNDDWEPVEFTTLLSYKDGQLVRTGTKHEHEYIDNVEAVKYLYQIFSDL